MSCDLTERLKRAILLLPIVFLMIGACGCDMTIRKKNNMMLSYIKNKYPDDNFEYVGVTGGYLGSNTKKIIVKSEKYPDRQIRVICVDKDGDLIFSDTYLNVKFEQETRSYIEKSLSDAFGEKICVRYTPSNAGNTKNGSADTSFSQFISDSTTYVYFVGVVVCDNVDENEAFDKIERAFADGVVLGDIYFVDSTHEQDFENNAFSLVEERKYTKTVFFVKSTVDQYKTVKWKYGT